MPKSITPQVYMPLYQIFLSADGTFFNYPGNKSYVEKESVTMNRTATCCCGQASIMVDGEPKIHLVCHCNNCKKRTGSAFGVSAYFPDSQVKNKNGEMEVYEINNHATHQERYFCKLCGTTLYWKISKFPAIPGIADMTGIAGGCFSDNPLPEPTITATNKNKCTWLEVPKMKIVS